MLMPHRRTRTLAARSRPFGGAAIVPAVPFLSIRSPRAYVRRVVQHLLTEHGSTPRLAAAVGLGVLVGTLPAFGLHLAITIALGTVLRLNRIVMYAAANISNPLFAPFLIFASVQAGHLVLHARLLPLNVDALRQVGAARFLGDWIAGSLVVGSILGALGAAITYVALSARRRRALQAKTVFDQVGDRYVGAGRFAAGYVRGKLRGDPIYRALVDLVPEGSSVADLGCGDGHAAILLALRGCTVRAYDWDERKLERARAAALGLSVRIERADVRQAAIDPCDVALLLDVLHYFPAPEQDAVLGRAAAALRPGGTLLVRDIDAARGWRSLLTRIEERVVTLVRFHRAARLTFRPAQDLAAVLERAGLSVEVRPMWQGTPFANVLIAGRRRAAASAAPVQATQVG